MSEKITFITTVSATCEWCGNGLEIFEDAKKTNGIKIVPCDRCLEGARKDGEDRA